MDKISTHYMVPRLADAASAISLLIVSIYRICMMSQLKAVTQLTPQAIRYDRLSKRFGVLTIQQSPICSIISMRKSAATFVTVSLSIRCATISHMARRYSIGTNYLTMKQ